MIENDRVRRLPIEYLQQIADMYNMFDCEGLECIKCPFGLDEPYKWEGYISYRCLLAYAKELCRRMP